MDFAFSEEQEMLRTSARDFLAKESPSSYVRRMMEADDRKTPRCPRCVAVVYGQAAD